MVLRVMLVVGLLAGCGGSADEMAGAASGDFNGGGGGGGGAQAPGGNGGGGGDVEPEPETVVPISVPQAGVHYVFLTDPSLDALVRIDAVTLEVTLIDVGSHPDVVAVFPGTDTVAALSGGSDRLAVVDAAPGAEVVVRSVPVADGTNAITLAPDGKSAVVWFDAARATGSKLGPLQSVTLVRLGDEPTSVTVSVGFEPRGVAYTTDSKTAYIVTRAGITPIDVAKANEASLIPEIAVTDDPQGSVIEREVHVTPDGARAVVRELGAARLIVVDLESGALSVVGLPGQPTDLDLLHDGSRALVVLKTTAQAALVDLDDPTGEGAVTLVDLPWAPGVAWITQDDSLALLYTTEPTVESLIALDLSALTTSSILLQKGVTAVATTEDSRWALVTHSRRFDKEGRTTRAQVDAEVDKSFGYSVVDLKSGFAKLFLTAVDVAAVAFAPEDGKAYVMLPGGTAAGHSVSELRLGPLLESRISLVSPPTHIIPVLAARRMAVPQAHASGRVTFIDTAGGATSTVTGFELNALID